MRWASSSRSPTGSEESQSPVDAKKILAECCEIQNFCRLQLVHSDFSTPAMFVSMNNLSVELSISSEDADARLLAQAIACVSFPYRTSFCAFLGCLIDVRKRPGGERRAVVSIPQHVITTNLRQTFRVPVLPNAGLETSIITADGTPNPIFVRDITDAGVELEFPDEDYPVLLLGSVLLIEFRFRGEAIQRHGEIRRLTGRKVGLSFEANPTDPQENQQAIRMNGLVLAIQQHWLRSRLK